MNASGRKKRVVIAPKFLFPKIGRPLGHYAANFIAHREKERIKAFAKLNVTAFPESPNAYDSLSDAYLANGQKELARQNAKKALELLALDTTDPQARRDAIRDSAQLKLKQLGEVQP